MTKKEYALLDALRELSQADIDADHPGSDERVSFYRRELADAQRAADAAVMERAAEIVDADKAWKP